VGPRQWKKPRHQIQASVLSRSRISTLKPESNPSSARLAGAENLTDIKKPWTAESRFLGQQSPAIIRKPVRKRHHALAADFH